MTRDRLVSVFVVLAAAAVGLVVLWLAEFRHPGPGSTVVLVEPTTTPLRDSIREPKAAKKKGSSASAARGGSLGAGANPGPRRDSRPAAQSPTRTGTNKAPSTPRKRQTPARRPAPSSSPQSPPSSPPTPSQPAPLVTVQTPGRTPSVCTPQIGINC